MVKNLWKFVNVNCEWPTVCKKVIFSTLTKPFIKGVIRAKRGWLLDMLLPSSGEIWNNIFFTYLYFLSGIPTIPELDWIRLVDSGIWFLLFLGVDWLLDVGAGGINSFGSKLSHSSLSLGRKNDALL